jgi:DNA-binding NarL/FixJ family response regulator
VLTLIGQGYSNKLVADVLSLSPQTVKNYTHSIMQKLGAHNRVHTVMLALKHNWLQLEAR